MALRTIDTNDPSPVGRLGQVVRCLYISVFHEDPRLATKTLPGGDQVLVVNEWLVIFATGFQDQHVVRVDLSEVSGATHAWFQKYPCLLTSPENDRATLEGALTVLFMMEAHRALHVAREQQGRECDDGNAIQRRADAGGEGTFHPAYQKGPW